MVLPCQCKCSEGLYPDDDELLGMTIECACTTCGPKRRCRNVIEAFEFMKRGGLCDNCDASKRLMEAHAKVNAFKQKEAAQSQAKDWARPACLESGQRKLICASILGKAAKQICMFFVTWHGDIGNVYVLRYLARRLCTSFLGTTAKQSCICFVTWPAMGSCMRFDGWGAGSWRRVFELICRRFWVYLLQGLCSRIATALFGRHLFYAHIERM
jgi:hypothetical protein